MIFESTSMAKTIQEVNLPKLSRAVSEARQKKGWTLEQLSHELWQSGFPTAQNKLWRLENKPPKRIDTELLLFLEKVLDVPLLDTGEQKQVLIEDVIDLIDGFVDSAGDGPLPDKPANRNLGLIYEKLLALRNSG